MHTKNASNFNLGQCSALLSSCTNLQKMSNQHLMSKNVNKQLTCHCYSCWCWVIYQEQRCLRPQRRWRSQCLLGIWNILSGRLHRLLQQWLDQSLRWKGQMWYTLLEDLHQIQMVNFVPEEEILPQNFRQKTWKKRGRKLHFTLLPIGAVPLCLSKCPN